MEGDVISVRFNGLKSSLHCAASGRSDWFQANIDPGMAKRKQVLRIHRVGEGRDAEYFYLALRRAIGMDSGLARYTHDEIRSASYVDRVSVHRFKPDALGYRERMTCLVGLLKEKESYSDRQSGISVTIDSLKGGVANVKVTIARGDH